jgi:hypothetical protein
MRPRRNLTAAPCSRWLAVAKQFVADSLLEGAVTSELVSKVNSGARKNQIFRGFWMILAF